MAQAQTTYPSSQLSALSSQTKTYAQVAIDLPISINQDDYFYYSIPEEIKDDVKVGTIVHVPFGKQETNGYVLNITTESPKKDFHIKPIFEVIYKKQIWNEKYFELVRWISKYYLTNIGTILSASIGSEVLTRYTHEVEMVSKIEELPALRDEQQVIVNKLIKSKNRILSYKYLQQKLKFSKQKFYQIINQLKTKGIVKTIIRDQRSEIRDQKKNFTSHLLPLTSYLSPLTFNKEQLSAYNTILKSIQEEKPNTFLLHGVTGSGKTEVYLKLIEEVLKLNKKVIYLVPEIYQIPQTLQRLISRFEDSKIVIWHSSISASERLRNLEKLIKGDAKIVLGARSGILTPIQNLGLIVIDEAHDSSYKQASPAPRYNTINVAIKRGEIENCTVVLGTATPNITDYYQCLQNNTILELKERVESIPMPKVQLVDLKNEYPKTSKTIISNDLKNGIQEALSKNEQIILLLNRRGYSSHLFCRACGYIQFCKNCSVPMVFHKNLHSILCHHCGYRICIENEQSMQCPKCTSPHFKYFGLGTQQLEEEVKKIFKGARTIRVDSDQLRRKDEYIKLWQEFSSHNADILIGTQIVAKGLDLPNVTVVGVILADTMLNFPDYVSYERAFQLLTQVTGRAGRGLKPGKVFIQTYQIDNPLFKFIQEHDFINFYKKEIKHREEFLYPPFTGLSRLIFQSYDEKECIDYANETLKILIGIDQSVYPRSKQGEHIGSPLQTFLGPAPCFFTKLHGKYRYHILCKIKNEETKILIFNNTFQTLPKNPKVELIVDVDSLNLL